MPSISNLLTQDPEELKKQLDYEREQNQQYATPLEGPDKLDLLKAGFDSGYVNNIGFKLGSYLYDKTIVEKQQTLSETTLQMLYPDAPKDFFKGGATPYQAEMLYDKFTKARDVSAIQQFIYGPETQDTPDWWVIGKNGRNVMSGLGGLASSFADPLFPIMAVTGGVVAEGALPLMAKVAPEITKRVAMSIGTSRLASQWLPEVLGNLAADVAISYPTQVALQDYTKEKPDLLDTTLNSVGTALVFGTVKSAFKGYNVDYFNRSALNINQAIEGNLTKNIHAAGMSSNSATHNVHALKEIIKDSFKNPIKTGKSVIEKIKERSLTSKVDESFDTKGKVNVGIADREGHMLYTGTKHGDNLTFIDDHKAVQGMVNEYNSNDNNKINLIASQQLENGSLNLLDINIEPLDNHPEIMNIIDGEYGSISDLDLPEKATVNDLFSAINESSLADDRSGADLVKLYNDINAELSKKGYDGIKFLEDVNGKTHTVSEVFPDKVDNLTNLGEVQPNAKPEIPTINPIEEDIATPTGEKIPAEPTLHDPYYAEDPEVNTEYAKYNDPAFMETLNKDNESFIDEDIKMMEEDIKAEVKINSILENPEEVSLKERMDALLKENKEMTPEESGEIFKVLENCKGKL